MVIKMSESNNTSVLISAVMGLAFIAMGLLEMAAVVIDPVGVEIMRYLSSGGNILLALVLLFTGVVLLNAASKFRKGTDGEAYLVVGCMLALFVGLVVSLTFAASATEAYLFESEDFVDWSPADDFTPAIPMMIPSLAVLLYALRAFRSEAQEPTP